MPKPPRPSSRRMRKRPSRDQGSAAEGGGWPPRIWRSRRAQSRFFSSRCVSSGATSAAEDSCEHYGVVVLAVAGGVDEGERAGPCSAAQLRKPRTLMAKLIDVSAAELVEATRLVRKPLPQFGAR